MSSSTVIPTTTLKSTTTTTNYNSNRTTTIQANMFWQKQPKANAELFALTYGALVAELLRDIEDPVKVTEELDRMGHSIGVRCIEEVLAKAASTDYTSIMTSMGGGAGNTGASGGGGGGDGGSGGGGLSSSSVSVISRSQSFPESAEIVKVALRMFLGLMVETSTTTTVIVDPTSTGTTSSASSSAGQMMQQQQQQQQQQYYSIKFADNPLAIFVELPEEYRNPSGTSDDRTTTTSTTATATNRLEYSQLLAGMCRGMLEMLQFDCRCSVANSVLMGGETNEIRIELKQVLQDGAGDEYHEE